MSVHPVKSREYSDRVAFTARWAFAVLLFGFPVFPIFGFYIVERYFSDGDADQAMVFVWPIWLFFAAAPSLTLAFLVSHRIRANSEFDWAFILVSCLSLSVVMGLVCAVVGYGVRGLLFPLFAGMLCPILILIAPKILWKSKDLTR